MARYFDEAIRPLWARLLLPMVFNLHIRNHLQSRRDQSESIL